MADISKVTLPNNETYDLKDSVARGGIGNAKLFYGTCSSAAAATEKAVTCSEFISSDLVAGTMINVKFDNTNSGAVASLTLNVNGTGAKSIKYIYNNELTNIPAVGYLLKNNMYTFRYDGTYWVVQLMYNSNTTTGYGYYDYYFRACAGTSAIYRYKIVGMGEDNRLYPIVTTNQTSSAQVAKEVQTVGIRPGHLWVYYSTTTASAGGAIAAATLLAGGGGMTVGAYSFNESIPTYRTIYLRGTYDREKDLFYLYDDGTTPCKSYYTFVPTNSAVTLSDYFVEGNYYMIVGGSYSSENYFSIFADNPLYYFDGTNLIPVSTKVAKDEITSMVGTDEQEDNDPYSFRKTANGKISSSSVAAYDEIIGGSIVWNQYLQTHTGYSITTGTGDGLTISITDGWVNIVGTPTALTRIVISPYGDYVDANHKILFSCDGYNGFDWERSGFTTTYNRSEFVHTHTAAWGTSPRIVLYAGTEYNIKARFNVTDLTEAFGIDIADYIYNLERSSLGSGVAWLREYYIKKHHEYSVPTFQHVQVSAKETVGFNALDIDTYISTGFSLSETKLTNVKIDARTAFQPTIQLYKNGSFVATITTNYYSGTGRFLRVFNTGDYDASIMLIKHSGSTADLEIARIPYSELVKNTDYCWSVTVEKNNPTVVGGLVLDENCISLQGNRDGEYEPYCKHIYPIEAKVLKGVPKRDSENRLYFDGDIYRHDGTVKRRMYTVNSTEFMLGTYDASTSRWTIILPSSAPEHKYVLNSDVLNMIPTNGFPVVSKNNLTALSYGLSASDASVLKYMILKLDATQITTLAQATEWLQNNPFELTYEVNEPTIEAAEPYQFPMSCDGYGTEEFVDYGVEQGTRDIAIPVGHNTKYRSGVYGEVGLKADTSYVDELVSDIDNSIPDWAKAPTKPTYTASEVGLGNVGNFKAVSTVASQGLTDTEKANARANIGAATSGHTHTTTIASGGTSQINLAANTAYTLTAGGTNYVFKTPVDSDTKNTAGSTDTSSEIYLVGATSQAANPQTYSHDTARVRANGRIVGSGYEFAVASAMGTTKATMVYDSTLEAIAFQFD